MLHLLLVTTSLADRKLALLLGDAAFKDREDQLLWV